MKKLETREEFFNLFLRMEKALMFNVISEDVTVKSILQHSEAVKTLLDQKNILLEIVAYWRDGDAHIFSEKESKEILEEGWKQFLIYVLVACRIPCNLRIKTDFQHWRPWIEARATPPPIPSP